MKNNKVIITAAITGAEVTKEQNPNLPCTPEEQAEAAYACYQAGASIVHIHVRDDELKPSQDIARFEKTTKLIKSRCNIIIQYSTGGAVGEKIERRLAPLQLKPEMASLNVGSINFGNEVFVNLPQDIELLASEMKKFSIKPEIEVYDIGMLEYGVRLVEKGILNRPAHFQFVMGTGHGISATKENLEFMSRKIPKDSTFAVAGIGRFQLEMAKPAIELGGHIRCGFEDNIYFTKGVLAKSNAQLVERMKTLVEEAGKSVASVKEAREILGLAKA